MKIDLSEPERNAAILLSSATSYILQQIASLIDELDSQAKVNVELSKQNQELREKIKSLEEASKTEPSLSIK